MKARMLVEVQIDNDALLKQFGAQLAEVTSSGVIELKLAEIIGTAVSGVPHLVDVQVSVIPVALRSDRL